MTTHLPRLVLPTLLLIAFATPAPAADWPEVQKLKAKYLGMAAQHAMEQQKTTTAAPIAIALAGPDTAFFDLRGGVKPSGGPHDPGTQSLDISAAAKRYNAAATEQLWIQLPKPLDLSAHSGLALTVKTEDGTSPEVRLGVRLTNSAGKAATIDPCVPVLNAFGGNPHEIYFDWAFLNYANVEDALAVLKDVKTIELTFASALRAPQRGGSKTAQPAKLTLSDLRAVDYLQGSYDPDRQSLTFDKTTDKFVPSTKHDLTLMHRTQEVTGIVALNGGDAGVKSAIQSLDFCVRTQCWDGSFLDGRRGAVTVASGEYTFGFTIYGTLTGYLALEKAKHPALDEKLTIGPDTLTRREFYQRMFYRAALARTAALPVDYRDDIIGGDTLTFGANRVLGYAIAMRMVADALTDPAQKKEILAKFDPIMQQIADAQGKYSGGFPLLGEGDMYKGKGIHYDAGYTRTHMDFLIAGAVRTGDPRLIKMLERYQTVFDALMDETGTGIVPLLSERHPGTESVQLILPDATAQIGLQYKLPIIAQWGYNCGIPVWKNWETKPGNHFSYASHVRGYPLGAHMQILADDLAATPEPQDLGYLFPRQFPIWSSKLFNKEGKPVRTSHMIIKKDGTRTSDFSINVGEYPETVGVPVLVKTKDGPVVATAELLSGWPKLLPANAPLKIQSGTEPLAATVGKPFELRIGTATMAGEVSATPHRHHRT